MADGTTLPEKLPGNSVFVDFDFTDIFNDGVRSGVTIAGTPTIAITALTAVEDPAVLEIDGGVSLDTTNLIASAKLKNGTPGASYLLTCDAIANNGASDSISLILPVVDIRLG